jgi:hypothetical protein
MNGGHANVPLYLFSLGASNLFLDSRNLIIINNDLTVECSFLGHFTVVSGWLLFNVNSAIFQLYHGENKLLFNEMMTLCAIPTLKQQSANRHVAQHIMGRNVSMCSYRNCVRYLTPQQSILLQHSNIFYSLETPTSYNSWWHTLATQRSVEHPSVVGVSAVC